MRSDWSLVFFFLAPSVTVQPVCANRINNCDLYGKSVCTGTYRPWATDNCAKYCDLCTSECKMRFFFIDKLINCIFDIMKFLLHVLTLAKHLTKREILWNVSYNGSFLYLIRSFWYILLIILNKYFIWWFCWFVSNCRNKKNCQCKLLL